MTPTKHKSVHAAKNRILFKEHEKKVLNELNRPERQSNP